MAHWLPPARTKVFLTRPKHMNSGQLEAPTGLTSSTSPVVVPSVRVVAGRPTLFAAVGVLSMLMTYSAYYNIVLLPQEQEDDGGGGMGSGSATVTAPMLGQQRWRRLDGGDHETMMSYFLVREPDIADCACAIFTNKR